jgi:hypothetical protein
LTCSCQVSGTGQSVMARSDYDYIPGSRGNFFEWGWKTDLSQDCCRRGHIGSIYAGRPIARRN